jgi:hypothetical protein
MPELISKTWFHSVMIDETVLIILSGRPVKRNSSVVRTNSGFGLNRLLRHACANEMNERWRQVKPSQLKPL